jgi:hypothetical protein
MYENAGTSVSTENGVVVANQDDGSDHESEIRARRKENDRDDDGLKTLDDIDKLLKELESEKR